MPRAPRAACRHPRCPGYAVHRGYCAVHKRSEEERGYGRAHRIDREANRPGASCERCGATTRLERDHRVPPSLGGDESPGNKRWLCIPCHHLVGVRSTPTRAYGGA